MKLTLISQDVIHSFYLPHMRTKTDVVPGMYVYLAFTPTLTGDHPVYCSMFCGTGHSDMLATLHVLEPEDYDRWLATGKAPVTDPQRRKFRLLTAVARQGFELCSLRERPAKAAEQQGERTLEPLLPGFICASAAMARVADQIQRVQGQTLTVLITGESGTGKDLIARAIHAGSPRRTAPTPSRT